MTINLTSVQAPAFLKIGFFGDTGTGKTFTAAKVLSQFIATYAKGSQLAMFDTEPSAGYIKDMVKSITGKDLLAIHSRSFSDLLEFARLVKDRKYVALLDSATHPWRSLMKDYLDAKKSRVKAAHGNPDTARLSLKDWGPIKDVWAAFSEAYCYDPVHWCMNGREGDRWETVTDDEGNDEMKKTGVKMKTETETGYEPSLLVQMRLVNNEHRAFVVKDRFDVLTGQESKNNPDIEFFMPHIKLLNLGGVGMVGSVAKPVFTQGSGPSYETLKARREGLLENIKDDIVLIVPGMAAADKAAKIKLLRDAFGTSSWTELEADDRKFPAEVLKAGRETLATLLATMKSQEAK
jgi:hypothetical protein